MLYVYADYDVCAVTYNGHIRIISKITIIHVRTSMYRL